MRHFVIASTKVGFPAPAPDQEDVLVYDADDELEDVTDTRDNESSFWNFEATVLSPRYPSMRKNNAILVVGDREANDGKPEDQSEELGKGALVKMQAKCGWLHFQVIRLNLNPFRNLLFVLFYSAQLFCCEIDMKTCVQLGRAASAAATSWKRSWKTMICHVIGVLEIATYTENLKLRHIQKRIGGQAATLYLFCCEINKWAQLKFIQKSNSCFGREKCPPTKIRLEKCPPTNHASREGEKKCVTASHAVPQISQDNLSKRNILWGTLSLLQRRLAWPPVKMQAKCGWLHFQVIRLNLNLLWNWYENLCITWTGCLGGSHVMKEKLKNHDMPRHWSPWNCDICRKLEITTYTEKN